MTQEEFDMERERDANIKKMLAQMYLLQEHIMENARKIKWISGLFRFEEGCTSRYLKTGKNHGWISKR